MITLWLALGVVVLLLLEAMLAVVSYSQLWTRLKMGQTMWSLIIEAVVIDIRPDIRFTP